MSVTRPEICQFLGYRLDFVRRRLLAPDGSPVALMPKAIDTLMHLVTHAGRTVSKEDLLKAVWPTTVVEENNLTQNISALRKAFGEKRREHRFIVTIPGQGYRFVAPVSELSRDDGLLRNHAAVPVVASGAAASVDSAGSTRPLTVAVLPFKPLLQEQRNEALELGMADSLIMELSRSTRLIVRPLSATRRFTSLDEDAIEAGRRLDVDAVVDGTIQIGDGRLRVSARLLRTEDGRNLWAGKFDEEFSSLFRVQDAIAQRLAQALEIRLGPPASRQTENLQAYELYMRGRLHALRLVMPEVRRGITFFEQAILADPSYALPQAGIADALRAMVLSNDTSPAEVAARSKVSAERAIQLAPDLPEANIARGLIALFFDWDWSAAEDYLAHAVELASNSGEAHIYLAHLCSILGRHGEALAHARRAREINPISPMIVALEGQFLGFGGESEAAIRRLNGAITMAPTFWLSHHLLAQALIDAGRYEASLAESAEAKRLSPMQTYSDALTGVALARLGRRDEARAILASLTTASDEKYVPPTHLALLETALGAYGNAIAHLEAALSVRDARLVFLKVDRKWDGLRSQPGFEDITRRMGV
ncbi:MAG TPA: winged helix-turn-helix domain-containing protein [Gammaproteobacteria bacterium]